tara:strand:+ start:54 stop:227 length:174 start_codon:yes stop_codon:yes gene_type:complete
MPQSLEDLVEQFREEGLSESEAVKAAKKRFLQETKRNKKIGDGDKIVAAAYGGLIGK